MVDCAVCVIASEVVNLVKEKLVRRFIKGDIIMTEREFKSFIIGYWAGALYAIFWAVVFLKFG